MASRPAYPQAGTAQGPDHRGGKGFALLSPAFLDELRARTSLSGLIRRTVKLQKAGNEWKACCPFHHEKSPSFYVNDDKQFYHCFGCSAHGDAIRFLTDGRGLSFMDAVKELADAAGLQLPAPDPATRERAERAASLHDVMASAATWFTQQLAASGGTAARDYCAGRALSTETQAAFGFGFAPDGRKGLAEALAHYPRPMLVEAGLLIQPEGGGEPYDRFRGRLIIPIADQRGRIIAFGGRIIGQGEPKYLNSPDTPLFDKGATLFNLHRAAPASRKTNRLIVVEGYLDAIALAQAGIEEAVAPLGTALTERQMERLWNLVDTPILCFDGDGAGRKAALRAAERAMPLLRPGKSLAFATLPPGMDPDDLVRGQGREAFEAVVASTTPLLRLLYEREREAGDMRQPEARAQLRSKLDELAQSCTDRIVAQEYKRSFNDIFFEDFGWKKGERTAIASAALHTGPRKALDLHAQYLRSVLFGLSRHPDLLRRRVEQVSDLHIDHPKLRRWRDVLVGAVYRGGALDGDCIAAILEADGLAEVQKSNLCMDLRFPFERDDLDEAQRIGLLDGLVAFLHEERELDVELSGLDRAAEADAGRDAYLAIEAQRQYLRERRASLHDWAAGLGMDDQE